MGEIYRLDFENGKSYIGITEKTSSQRFKGHACSARNGAKTLIHNAWRKYGAPKLTVIAIVENYDLLQIEVKAIKEFNTLAPNGYNSTEGGDFNPSKVDWINKARAEKSKGRPIHPNSAKALELANKNRIFTESHRAALSKAGKGKPKSIEHRRKISEAHKGLVNSPEAIEKMRIALTGRKNPEHAKRMLGNQNWKFKKSISNKEAN